MQKLIELFDDKINIVNDSVDIIKSTEDIHVKSMLRGMAFEEFSHLHCMKRYMRDNNIKVPDASMKSYNDMEQKLMSL